MKYHKTVLTFHLTNFVITLFIYSISLFQVMYVPNPLSSGIDSFSYVADDCAEIMQVYITCIVTLFYACVYM
jgi:hypothetical protein